MKAKYLDEQEGKGDCQSFGNPFHSIILRFFSYGFLVQQNLQLFVHLIYMFDACRFKWHKVGFRKATHCQRSPDPSYLTHTRCLIFPSRKRLELGNTFCFLTSSPHCEKIFKLVNWASFSPEQWSTAWHCVGCQWTCVVCQEICSGFNLSGSQNDWKSHLWGPFGFPIRRQLCLDYNIRW